MHILSSAIGLQATSNDIAQGIPHATELIVAAEHSAQGSTDQLADIGVADNGPGVLAQLLQALQQAGAAADLGHLVLCDSRVVCRHHHNELLPSNE